MKNKFLITAVAVLTIAIIILGVEVGILAETVNHMNQRDKIELPYEGQMIKIEASTYATIAVNFQVDSGVLYDCVATVSYVASNDSSVQITKQLGVLNMNTNHMGADFQLTDYPSGPFLFSFSSSNPLPNVQIEAYGFTKPASLS